MFRVKNATKSTLLSGTYDLTQFFTFEAAMHWALEGRYVLYITPTPLDSIPAKYHDRDALVVESFRMVKFMYLKDYEALIELLVDLHSHHTRPGVLLVDQLDTYINHPKVTEQILNIHIAKLCAILHDTMNACSNVSKRHSNFHLLASVTPQNFEKSSYHLYFDQIWNLEKENKKTFQLIRSKNSSGPREVFKYQKLNDGTLILKKILEKLESI
ncbi:uncharacterized protein LOC107040613 [Diachasma alloeum]|uniref:uncharacterized protein LOC107040613 n=1 Tax=Diachasma alloeum TaxID=454923 RepID=UPI00073845F4|nr:uncharacterized protein LOC107040613 [Diachasma alloeum]